jgi:hypothetical protein
MWSLLAPTAAPRRYLQSSAGPDAAGATLLSLSTAAVAIAVTCPRLLRRTQVLARSHALALVQLVPLSDTCLCPPPPPTRRYSPRSYAVNLVQLVHVVAKLYDRLAAGGFVVRKKKARKPRRRAATPGAALEEGGAVLLVCMLGSVDPRSQA